ncbi:MAG: hypothetical protein HPY89_00050 [Pelotomaculum sp.]|uniref:Uncharacterized protein n=1 Tax=Pelotomaculum thermopropionicum (strain DSM 13744 / JCM 10971 / SI) TaxID=370438 RepID=A5D2L8_PELTS|nr:hypothetical protein [Pelotomaculum sp.]BAF59502.1 hypothetical protein PTH_1321 [Pelotomaculum thermopropionicum SI]
METESIAFPRFETVCIEVPKVYDFCFQAEHRENICTPLNDCNPPEGATVRCTIDSTNCAEVSRTTPNNQGRANVTFAVTVYYTLEVLDCSSNVVCTFANQSFSFTKTVVLCAPEGTFTNCEIVNAACGPCLILGNQICCTFDLCITIQSLAIVKLLVPSFGFCTPALCEQVSPIGPFVCPPQLFPPQCPPAE